jgi:polysaccharide biosynthesis transport protein
MDVIFLINALLRKKWVIIVCTVAGITAGFLLTLTKKKLYLSTAQYSTGFTMKQQVRIGNDDAFSILEVDMRFKNVLETFKSPVVICMLSYDLMLHDLDEKTPFKVMTPELKEKPAYKNAVPKMEKIKQLLREKKLKRDILKAYNAEENIAYELIKLYEYDNETILDQLIVEREEGTDYLNIAYRSENPEMSAFVVNTIGDEFIGFYNSISSKRTVESAGKLDSLAQNKKKDIDAKNNKLQQYKITFGSPDVADKAKGALAILAEVTTRKSVEESQLNKFRGTLASINTQLENIEKLLTSGATTTSSSSGSNAEYLSLRTKNAELREELSRKGNDPAIQAQIDANTKRMTLLAPSSSGGNTGGVDKVDLRRRRDDLMSLKIVTENDIRAQEATVSSLKKQADDYNRMASTGAGADVVVKAMQDEIDLDQKQYENMLDKLQTANDVNVAPDINFKQTLLGQPAIKPESLNRKLTIGLSAFGALMISSIFIIMMDFLDHSVRAPSVFNKLVNIKLLTTVNKIDLKTKQVADYFNMGQEERAIQDSQFVENMRKLRFEIENSGKKIILFTSTQPAQGKTIIIEALAHSFSLSKKRVLLIDTNFSNNTLTQIFEAKPVLEQVVLNDEKNAVEKFMGATSMTKIPQVDIIGCKEGNFSPSEVLPKDNLLQHLRTAGVNYDYILLEGAALNYHADSKELAKYVDAIVPVFAAHASLREGDKESIKFLKEDMKNKTIGSVLNKVEKDNMEL